MILMPRLYAILDTSCFSTTQDLLSDAAELLAAGVTLIQYRNKSGNAREILAQTRELKTQLSRTRASAPHIRLIMNDRADLCLAASFDGVHVGRDDLLPASPRNILGPERWLRISTHNAEQV